MSLFVDYIQPLTNWLQANPHWSLFITFIISLTESLAIIGSIVPGSVTMTTIGILAGSGIMRIDLTLLAAILGAITGDSLSYILGYYYSERLVEIWPFKKYPKLIKYGKEFFATHGGKSVLIGRFIGPLRSIIPVIAGILHMKHWRFFIANVLSAIGWSILYVMPGVIIGAASHELSTKSATHLFTLILVLLAGIWLLSIMIKWLVVKLNALLKRHLHDLWVKFKKYPLFIKTFARLSPINEENHYPTASLVLMILFCFACFMILLGLAIQNQWITLINLPVNLFFQSAHTPLLELFFIFCTQLTSTATIISLYFICCCWFIYNKNTNAIVYLSSLIILNLILVLILIHSVNSPRPPGLLVTMAGSSFPAMNLEIATAFYGFIFFYINQNYYFLTNTFRAVLFTVLGLSGLGTIYLGDYWLTDVLAAYFAGATLGLIYCLLYRKFNITQEKKAPATMMICSLIVGLLLPTLVNTFFNFNELIYNHKPYHKEYTLSQNKWWNQQKPILPAYRLNRIGNKISLLNIQYDGDLSLLKDDLEQNGWKLHSESFLTNLLLRMNNQSQGIKLPLLTQLYDNKAPALMMTYTSNNAKLVLELRIWESNYYLSESNKPLWIGSIHSSIAENNKQEHNKNYSAKLINPLTYMLPALNQYTVRRIKLPGFMIKKTTYPTQPYIILIKKRSNTPSRTT